MDHGYSGQLTALVIPKPSSSDPSALMEITDPSQIMQILLCRNQRKLQAAHDGYFNYSTLCETVGDFDETAAAESMIQGTFNVNQVDSWNEYDHKPGLKAFLKKSSTTKD